MVYLIGTDEAGYGPNLGPLVISATLWHLRDDLKADELYQVLDEVVASAPAKSGESCRVAIADSKRLYQQGKGLRHLERGLMAALACVGRRPSTWRQLWASLSPDSVDLRDALPWYTEYDSSVPVDNDPGQCHAAAARLLECFDRVGVRLVDLRSRVVFEEPFNRWTDQYGSKGETLSQLTLGLVAELADPLGDEAISVICDKHGGRNRYARLLADWFPDWLIEVYSETRDLSLYRFGPPQRRVEFRFCTRAESYLPTALASMASKYMRELAMAALNDFWCQRVPGLVPTAGYPVDAQRFKQAIAPVQATLGILDNTVWRKR